MKTSSLEEIIAEVDAVQAQFTHVKGVLDQITKYDPVVGEDLNDAFDCLISRLAYHVNHSISYAYDQGKAENVENMIQAILEEDNLTKLELTCLIKQTGGYVADQCFIDPLAIAEILPGGFVDFEEAEGIPFCRIRLHTGTRLKVMGDADDMGDFINFILNPNAAGDDELEDGIDYEDD